MKAVYLESFKIQTKSRRAKHYNAKLLNLLLGVFFNEPKISKKGSFFRNLDKYFPVLLMEGLGTYMEVRDENK